MKKQMIDLDLLATYLTNKINEKKLSIRAAAIEIDCSAATLTRLLQGSKAENMPDYSNLIRAASWLQMNISDFEKNKVPKKTSITDVEVHLRALPDINVADADALIAMVKAGYEQIKRSRNKS